MKTTTPTLESHIAGDVTRLATCWRIRRRDGAMLGFTTHDRALDVDGTPYRPSSGFTPTTITESNRLNVDNLDVAGVLSDSAITEEDLSAGRYDGAEVEIFMVDWADPAGGRIMLRKGWIGEVTVRDGAFVAEVRGLMAPLQNAALAHYSAECRADLGDARCKVDLSAFAVQDGVAAVTDNRVFTAEALGVADGWFDYGVLRWLSGANAGVRVEVKNQTGDVIELRDAMSGGIIAGDLFHMSAGCDKHFTTCKTKFANAVNFRGEPHVPGTDAVLDYPGIR